MSEIRIAAAQSVSIAGDIAANVRTHTRFIARAHEAGVDVLVFPELSLTGYELPLLRNCLVCPEDAILEPIKNLARDSGITVIAGAPVIYGRGSEPSIASITFFPDGGSASYFKQHLHPGEEAYVVGVEADNASSEIAGHTCALAICADTTHESHPARAAACGASLYLASVLVSEKGYAVDSANLQRYAASLNIGVLMANHGGPSGGYVAAGKSTFWSPGGGMVVAAPGKGDCLVVASCHSGAWSGELLAV